MPDTVTIYFDREEAGLTARSDTGNDFHAVFASGHDHWNGFTPTFHASGAYDVPVDLEEMFVGVDGFSRIGTTESNPDAEIDENAFDVSTMDVKAPRIGGYTDEHGTHYPVSETDLNPRLGADMSEPHPPRSTRGGRSVSFIEFDADWWVRENHTTLVNSIEAKEYDHPRKMRAAYRAERKRRVGDGPRDSVLDALEARAEIFDINLPGARSRGRGPPSGGGPPPGSGPPTDRGPDRTQT